MGVVQLAFQQSSKTTIFLNNMERRECFDKIALSCISYLESFSECRNVNFQCGDGAASHESVLWEKRNAPFKLPKDLKNFYSMFNGVHLSWNVELGEKQVQIGEIRVNRMEALKPFEIEGSFDSKPWVDVVAVLPDPKTCSAFILDTHCEIGEIVLLYRQIPVGAVVNSVQVQVPVSPTPSAGLVSDAEVSEQDSLRLENVISYEQPEVWFVDQSSRWHYISKTFTQYFRLLVIHLGVHGWQLTFTPEGAPSTTQQWMTMFCKERLIIDRYWRDRLLVK